MYDVIVIGAGPAGIMASIAASKNKKKVLLIEKNDKIGKKLELTGGTRCNVTNNKTIENFLKEIPGNSKALYSTLNSFGPRDIINYFFEIGIPLKEEENNRMFPIDDNSKSIINALNYQLKKNNVDIKLSETVQDIIIDDNTKTVITNKFKYSTNNIIIATGGISYPQTGSTGDGLNFAKKTNHDVTDLYPAETFLLTKESLPLAGITLSDIKVSIGNKQSKGDLLFTHVGLSGPAIFKISEEVYHQLKLNEIVEIELDLIPKYNEEQLINALNNYESKKELSSFLKEYIPKRLSEYLFSNEDYTLKIASISKLKRKEIINKLKKFKISIKETGTIAQSFVTGGGVNINNINPKTFESKINKGIYFVGEVLDLHGHTGGYNITIALSTGFSAGNSI